MSISDSAMITLSVSRGVMEPCRALFWAVQYFLALSYLTETVSGSELVQWSLWISSDTDRSQISTGQNYTCSIWFWHKLYRILSSFDITLSPPSLKVERFIRQLISATLTYIRSGLNSFLNFLPFFNHKELFCISDHFIMLWEKYKKKDFILFSGKQFRRQIFVRSSMEFIVSINNSC